jgi:hypothetical protein
MPRTKDGAKPSAAENKSMDPLEIRSAPSVLTPAHRLPALSDSNANTSASGRVGGSVNGLK